MSRRRGGCEPCGGVVVSARMTTGASRPFAPCTVITRTSSRAISMSRLTIVGGGPQEREKSLQRRRVAALIGERKLEELVERVGSFEAEPRIDLAPALFRAEQPGEECERGFVARSRGAHGAAARRPPRSLHRSSAVPRARLRRLPRAAMGKRKQAVVIEAEQRALERDRKRQIVFRQQHRVGERHQVGDRDMLGKLQPVGARHRNPGSFQRPDRSASNSTPRRRTSTMMSPSRIGRRCPVRPTGVPASRRLAHRRGDLGRELHLRPRFRDGVERRIPGLHLGRRLGLDQRPDFDDARRRVGQRQMRELAVVAAA